ncbi:zinc dependent phospholipase C family protein [Sedimentibacter sp. B4]|uniref:zinc dependent phospholipase C family protein n=1 Tax=Sedimentibacter sp. B4 TaxID=304766 RepID=UPI0004BB2734|nr:zinc dependent phospholipase C family protein [Sedimentibacter sp. B4]
MPTTYAHYKFGMEVLKKLNDNIREIINDNIELYSIGLHGPDILFYFKPLKSNDISAMGHAIHKEQAKVFFEKARNTINLSNYYDASLSYTAGFICHFMLDSQCHPYIRQNENKFSHSEIEVELDRSLMIESNLESLSFKPTSHINPSCQNSMVISSFFTGVTAENIEKALKSMKFYLNLLVAPGKLKRSLISGALKATGNYDSMIDLMMKYERDDNIKEINERLLYLLSEAIEPTARLIEEYCFNIKNSDDINQRFNRNFD